MPSSITCVALPSKKLANHIGAIKSFFYHYNLDKAAA